MKKENFPRFEVEVLISQAYERGQRDFQKRAIEIASAIFVRGVGDMIQAYRAPHAAVGALEIEPLQAEQAEPVSSTVVSLRTFLADFDKTTEGATE